MEREKYVDESWKESVAKERVPLSQEIISPSAETAAPSAPQGSQSLAGNFGTENLSDVPEVNFVNYITSQALQTMIFLGEMPNPFTEKIEKNLPQAKFLIDTLIMIREKTKGNLNQQENDFLNASVYELQMKYVEQVQKEAK